MNRIMTDTQTPVPFANPFTEKALRAWGETFLALTELQHQLADVSKDMTFGDDWMWQAPIRKLINSIWSDVDLTPHAERFELAQEVQLRVKEYLNIVHEHA